jgi:hypothetical protein
MGYAQWYLSALAPTSPCGTIDSKTAQRHDDGRGAHPAVDQRGLTDKRRKMSGAARRDLPRERDWSVLLRCSICFVCSELHQRGGSQGGAVSSSDHGKHHEKYTRLRGIMSTGIGATSGRRHGEEQRGALHL